MDFVLLAAVLALSIFACVLSILILVKLKSSKADVGIGAQRDIAELKTRLTLLGNQLADEFERSRRESGQFQKDIRTETDQNLKDMAESLNEMKVEIGRAHV